MKWLLGLIYDYAVPVLFDVSKGLFSPKAVVEATILDERLDLPFDLLWNIK